MNIIACVKEVPNPCFPVEFDTVKNTVKDEEWNYVLNPCDEVAVEEAVRLKEKFGGEVTVITLGVSRAEEILRRCLAVGADRAIRLYHNTVSGWDAFSIATILSRAISGLLYDVILCGFQSSDRNGGEVGSMIAELLGLPVVTAAVKIDISADRKSAIISRRLERGAREVKHCPLPAVFTADLLLNEPRYPTLPGIKNSLKKEIIKISVESLNIDEKILEPVNQPTMVAGISRPPPKKIFIPTGVTSPLERIKLLTQGVAAPKTGSPILEGSPDEIARKATDFLFQKKILP